MNEWLKTNAITIVITIAGIMASFSIYGYRIDQLTQQVNEDKAAITVLNTQQVQLQVQLAQISTDVSYIKSSLDRLLK